MLYLIGGPAKVGKSKLAERLLQDKRIPYYPLDVFIEVLKENGHGVFGAETRAKEFQPYFLSILKLLPYYRSDFCVEGNAFMPAQVHELQSKVKEEMRVCFLGMSEANLKDILKHGGPATWLITDLTEEQRQEYPKWLVKNSKEVERQCAAYGYRYFDLAGNYMVNFESAYQYMIS
jgi:GTPase SAR1 family protein